MSLLARVRYSRHRQTEFRTLPSTCSTLVWCLNPYRVLGAEGVMPLVTCLCLTILLLKRGLYPNSKIHSENRGTPNWLPRTSMSMVLSLLLRSWRRPWPPAQSIPSKYTQVPYLQLHEGECGCTAVCGGGVGVAIVDGAVRLEVEATVLSCVGHTIRIKVRTEYLPETHEIGVLQLTFVPAAASSLIVAQSPY